MKLYVTDLDGTLLDINAEISPESAEQLNRLLLEKNITFFTARSMSVVKKIFNEVKWKLPCVVNNGAFIVDYSTGNYISEQYIDEENVKEIIDKAKEMNISYIVLCMYQGIEKMIYSDINNEGIRTFIGQREKLNDKRLLKWDNSLKLSEMKIFSLQFVDSFSNLSELRDRIRDDCLVTYLDREIYVDGYYYLNVNNKNATKEQALQKIIELLLISLNDVTAFGDQINDLEMLKMCGRGVAVSNANPELKKGADFVIGSNVEGSVIKFIANDK